MQKGPHGLVRHPDDVASVVMAFGAAPSLGWFFVLIPAGEVSITSVVTDPSPDDAKGELPGQPVRCALSDRTRSLIGLQ